MSAGVFFRLLQLVLQILRNTLLQHLPKPPHAMLRRSRAQLNLYMHPPVPDEKVDGHPSFTSSTRHNPGSWPHKVTFAGFGAALRLPSQSPDIVRVSHRRGGHLTTPWSLQNPYLLLESPSTAPSGVAQ